MSFEAPRPPRTLLGPGPGEMHPRVAERLGTPLFGHLDPAFLALMDATRERLKPLFGTESARTFTISGTGGAGREAALQNVIEPGDGVLAGVWGYFGGRMAECARRLGAAVDTFDQPWGEAPRVAEFAGRIRSSKPAVVCVVHAETSTGVLLSGAEMRAIGSAAREAGSLLVVDAVTSLGGVPVEADAWPADVVYSCSQKGLSCPPGLAPVTFGERAAGKFRARRAPVPSVYFDLGLLEKYWGPERAYHHTASSTLAVALHESLGIILEEGLPARFARQERVAEALVAGCAALGLTHLVPEGHRMPMVTPVRVPAGVDEAAVRRALLLEDGIEIGAGLGPLAGKIWRIGLMGYSCREENVRRLLDCLARRLPA